MHTMHTRERNFIFSFIYKGFRAFPGLFLYASPDAYKCIHAYKTGSEEPHNVVKSAHAAPRIGGSLDVLPTSEGGGTLTAKRSGRSPASGLYAFRPACMHPYASGDAYVFSFRFGLVPTFRGWSGGVYALYASFPYRGFEKKGGKPLILMHTMHTRERNFIFSFIYKGFRAFSGLFLYASRDAYRCIHAYKTAGRTSQYCEP